MKTTHFIAALVATCVFSMPVPGLTAGNYMEEANVSGSPSPTISGFAGSVISVDQVNKSVQLKNSSDLAQTFIVTNTTQLTRGGQSVTLSQINIGDQVVVMTSIPGK